MGPDLHSTFVAILILKLLGRPPETELERERVHRVHDAHTVSPASQTLGPAPLPHDVLCRVHFFTIKVEILAWIKCPLEFDGAPIHIYPDVSKHTRAMRGLLCLLLGNLVGVILFRSL